MKKLYSTFFILFLLISTWLYAVPPHLNHIMIIWGENTNYASATAQPYLYSLLTTYSEYSNYFAITHPSQPNYLAFGGGSTFITADYATCLHIPNQNLVDRLETGGITWREYQENYTAPCSGNALYVLKHDFFINFLDVQTSSSRTNNLYGFQGNSPSTYAELTGAYPPQFVTITPNLCNDGHDCGIAQFTSWLQDSTFFQDMLSSKYYTDGAIVVTFDENGSGSPNRIYCVVVSAQAKPGYKASTAYNHYSLLRTVEDNWGLATLTNNDAAAQNMLEAINAPVAVDLSDLKAYAPVKE